MPLKPGEKICTWLVNDMSIGSREALCGEVENGSIDYRAKTTQTTPSGIPSLAV